MQRRDSVREVVRGGAYDGRTGSEGPEHLVDLAHRPGCGRRPDAVRAVQAVDALPGRDAGRDDVLRDDDGRTGAGAQDERLAADDRCQDSGGRLCQELPVRRPDVTVDDRDGVRRLRTDQFEQGG